MTLAAGEKAVADPGFLGWAAHGARSWRASLWLPALALTQWVSDSPPWLPDSLLTYRGHRSAEPVLGQLSVLWNEKQDPSPLPTHLCPHSLHGYKCLT